MLNIPLSKVATIVKIVARLVKSVMDKHSAVKGIIWWDEKLIGDNLFLSTGDPYRNDPAYKEVSEAILFFYDNDDDFY